MNNDLSEITPPNDLSKDGMLAWFDIVNTLLAKQKIKDKPIEKINRLARIMAEKKKLIEELELKPEASELTDGEEQTTDYIYLADPREFHKRFIELIPEYETYDQAYQAVELEYHKTFNKTKYTGYDSFRNTCKNFVNN
ncbi:hypothetical protein SAMN05443144_102102 [Fodinibius roseus]|uniref:Uncharacterized protein n=1 Tax=Fodinibius roseus TaxID=1194090 RepID=A0A1M4UQZ1_9BACT|nr:hypothetical protein [Fodinibius roseus]SHE59023.1 hypothetical protein SAMN05443144_102102 [Fodinibius roseus]